MSVHSFCPHAFPYNRQPISTKYKGEFLYGAGDFGVLILFEKEIPLGVVASTTGRTVRARGFDSFLRLFIFFLTNLFHIDENVLCYHKIGVNSDGNFASHILSSECTQQKP